MFDCRTGTGSCWCNTKEFVGAVSCAVSGSVWQFELLLFWFELVLF